MPEAKKKPQYHGHRLRLRERFCKAGAETLADYELMEMFLFMANARGDVKPLAKTLIDRFGTFADAIAAPPERLAEVSGIGDASITSLKVIEAAALRLAQQRVLNRPTLSSWQALLDYCHASMAYNTIEQFRILFLDRKNILIADEVQQKGTVDHTPVYPREVVKRALDLGASGIIMVHNHPSGDPTPSTADIEMTRQVAAAAKGLGIALHDHIVVGRGGNTSFKSLGLL
ncbi:MAG: DNA repair protein RadC [Proteobacteria bacterium]|nr:DNA repair protein RadC [Pseudomonadota bacterium]